MEEAKKVEKAKLSRRDFLKSSGSVAAGAGLLGGGLLAGALPAEAAKLPKKWDYETDVVVIGSGFAGLAAALEAHNAGAKVMILEKMKMPGGNSIINGGLIAAAGSAAQKKDGIKDSPEKMFQDMLKAGRGLSHPDLARMVAEQSNDTFEWTIKIGAKYREKPLQLGGHSVARTFRTNNSSGSGIVQPMLKKCKELGLKINTGCMLRRLIQDKTGRVAGVEILEGYQFPNEKSGKVKSIKAKRAVVLATGGFGRDIPMRTVQDPRLTKEVDSTNQPGATAEGLVAALKIGATPVQISWIQLGPWACADEKGYSYGSKYANPVVFPRGVMVDPKTGKRFVNELADRKIRADAILATGHPAIGIADADGAKYYPLSLDLILKPGKLKKFDTLKDLAAAYGIPYEPLKQTVDSWNESVKKGSDKEFGRPIAKSVKPMVQAPFYGIRLWPKVHHCMGGMQINKKAQAINLFQKPIAGLYAAGEVTGGVHGAVRLGSCAIIDCLVFGRIAGKNAAAEKPWS